MKENNNCPISDTHALLLYLLLQFEKVCSAADIKWYASGGTCLGAVRHKGFIPWDDDIDIDMPRCYNDTFIEKCKELLPDNVILRTRDTDPYYFEEFIKMCYKDDEKGYSDIDLDIFLYDETNPKRKIFRYLQNTAKIWLYYIKEYKVSKDATGPAYNPNNFFKKALLSVFSHLSYKRIDKILYKVMTAQKKETGYFVNWGAAHDYKIATFEKKKLGVPRVLPFETASVYVANDTEYFLNRLYGKNYMQLPPEDKRKTHNVSMVSNSTIDIEFIKDYVADKNNWPKL